MNIDQTSYQASAKNFRQRFLVIHYTSHTFADSVKELTGSEVSSHYLLPTCNSIDATYPHAEIIVYALVPEHERAWHAGVSRWQNRINLNDSSIGIEVVNLSTAEQLQPFPLNQMDILIELCHDIVSRYPDITPNHVVGHSDIAVGRKPDPGPLFPWRYLYDHGIGAWYSEDRVKHFKQQFEQRMPSCEQVCQALYRYGYRYTGDPAVLLSAFQMHFRSSDYSGECDLETAAIAYALAEQYGEYQPE